VVVRLLPHPSRPSMPFPSVRHVQKVGRLAQVAYAAEVAGMRSYL